MPVLVSADGKVRLPCSEDDLARLRLALDGAVALDTESVPPAPQTSGPIAPEVQHAVPAYKLAAGADRLSPDECRYLATRLFIFIDWVLEGDEPEITADQLSEATARQGELVGPHYSFRAVGALSRDQWAALMRRSLDALKHASEHGGMSVSA